MPCAEYVLSIFRKKVCFQVTTENAKTQSWVTKTVWQQQWIPHIRLPIGCQ